MHQFHIPVLGLAFSIDSPLKVAHYGISSVISLSSDSLIEDMRRLYSEKNELSFEPISTKEDDYRAKRITAYLNMLELLVSKKLEEIRQQSLDDKSELTQYLELLPSTSLLHKWYLDYIKSDDQAVCNVLEHLIRSSIASGAIDVNIMTKVNKVNYDKDKSSLPVQYNDALSALRGFAESTLNSSVVFSAGFNPRLYSYLEDFPCFYPDKSGALKKKVILKVSDYRSAVVQGKFLAKKGIWISEFRIESGLNCGGHAFATEGLLMGPILGEFNQNIEQLSNELFDLCKRNWESKDITYADRLPEIKIAVQGGIGTADEQRFLIKHYNVQSTGWGTPFLFVPEATTVDNITLEKLIAAKSKDLYLSKTSPLGVPFNNIRNSESERVLKERIEKDRPGSPCLKKYLVSNTEFTSEPICTASRQYQDLKIKELKSKNLEGEEYKEAYKNIVVKACLCEDLSAPAYSNNGIKPKVKPSTAICPGPNAAFFSRRFTLKEMVNHIYGKGERLCDSNRSHMFINELRMYIEYLEGEWAKLKNTITARQEKYLQSFGQNLQSGIHYYEKLSDEIALPTFKEDLEQLKAKLKWVSHDKALM